jgi:hypothetical protein
MSKVVITNLTDLVSEAVVNNIDVSVVQSNATLAETSKDAAQIAANEAESQAIIARNEADRAEASKLTVEDIQSDINGIATTLQEDIDAVDAVRVEVESTQAEVTDLLADSRLLYDHFDDRYLGGYASNPIKDNDGHDIIDGAMYWNTMYKEIRIYDQTNLIWYTLPVPGSVLASNLNLADVADKAEARFNLDVYSIAEVDQAIADSLVTINADLGAQVTGVLI